MIIYAIGFDASTGAIANMELKGRNGQNLGDLWWKEGVETFNGICVHDFPNMFMISAPQSPFANLPIVLDNTADWIGKTLRYAVDNGYTEIDATKEAQDKYCKVLNDVYNGTVLPEAAKKAGSWYIGANIEGKPVQPLFWFGGVVPYFQMCQAEIDNGFPGLAKA
jgi:cation diffusion facilitator CzcD-associated flavoprotein CzcO